MKICSLTICNYKNYNGNQRIDFDLTNPDKNITLIGGKNGAGKTTLFEAIKLCMFGNQFSGKPIQTKQYEDYLRGCQNKTAKAKSDERYYIKMDVVLDDIQPVYTVSLKRRWTITPTEFNEKFTISRNGLPFEIVERENWQQFIYDMFPPYTIEYFFFDGEKMQNLVIGDNAEKILRESARDLIGLKIYDTLLNDIGVLKSKIKKSTQKDEKDKAEYNRLTQESIRYQKEIQKFTEKQSILESEIKTEEENIETLRADVQRKAGDFAKSHDTKKSEIHALEERLSKINSEITSTLDYVPFMMAYPLMKSACQQLLNEKKLKEQENNNSILESVREALAQEFRNSKETSKKITVLDSFKQTTIENFISIIHDVNNAATTQFCEFLREIEVERKEQFLNLLKEREETDIRLQKLLAALKKMPDTAFVEEELKQIEKKKSIIESARKTLVEISAGLVVLNAEYNKVSESLNDIDIASLKLVEDRSKYAACEKIELILQDYISYTLRTKVALLESTISSMYRKLENKEDLVEKMILNPQTFELTLIGYDGSIVNKDTLSSGEKEIYALSILWGLSQLSKNHLPIVVDSLLARLDDSHVGKVAEQFLSNAGEQVLILSHNREVNKEIYPLLKPRIASEYLLSYDENMKINEGYFPECK